MLFGPYLTFWTINTLLLTRIPGAQPLPYQLFTIEWLAAAAPFIGLMLFGLLGAVARAIAEEM